MRRPDQLAHVEHQSSRAGLEARKIAAVNQEQLVRIDRRELAAEQTNAGILGVEPVDRSWRRVVVLLELLGAGPAAWHRAIVIDAWTRRDPVRSRTHAPMLDRHETP